VSYRVVIPRSIPFGESNRVQREVWKRGYGTRIAGRDSAQPDQVVVEFLQMVEELPDPADVPVLEQDLERLLSGARIHSPFMGRGGWVETVQNRPVARKHSA
jgi:hypothetical protein